MLKFAHVRSLCRPAYLWQLLCHYKVYTVARTEPVLLGCRTNGRDLLWRMSRWAEHLAGCIDEMQEAWDARFDRNSLPHVFTDRVTGSIDTFPIYINRPPNALQRQYYNGKYGGHVLKVMRTGAHRSAYMRTGAHFCSSLLCLLCLARCRQCVTTAGTSCGTVDRTSVSRMMCAFSVRIRPLCSVERSSWATRRTWAIRCLSHRIRWR